MDKSNSLVVVEHVGNVPDVYEGYGSQLNYEFFENFESEHTKTAYKNDLTRFFKFLSQTFAPMRSIDDLNRSHVIAYRNYLQTSGGRECKPCCPKTVIRKLAAVKSYCDFLIEKGFMRLNPTSSVRRPRDEVITATQDLTDDQVRKLMEAVDTNKKSGLLHKAILALMFSTGLRKSELIHLKVGDYRDQDGYKIIQFVGKRGKLNRVPLHPTASYHLDRYILWMKDQGRAMSAEDWLFQPTRNHSNDGQLTKKLSSGSVDFIIKRYCRMIGIEARITPHSARATVIGSLLEHGCDLYKVAQLVNHSNVKTTQGYDKRGKKISDSPVFHLKFF